MLSEHLIDSMPDIHSEFTLIYDADSCQHSALIDVVNGDNLVIEGPPGSGKSQAITNLIAACINKGLSVLFVAKKLAALEVVKKRLELADLGDFCLEVHSHKSSKLGVQSLRALLECCETGHLKNTVETGKPPYSAFEIAVIRKLAATGYESETQVGVTGFYIDLAVRNPDKPGEFLMRIECNGATYHSAKSARDRDQLRQEVLEGLGWKIHRICSTDWFRNSDA